MYEVQPGNLVDSSKEASQGYILVENQRIDVKVSNNLGSINVLDVDKDGNFFVEIQEVVLNGGFQVDQKVYRYDASGNLTGMARIPLNQRYIPVSHSIAVAPDKNVYVLTTKIDGAEIQRLSFVPDLEPIINPSKFETKSEQDHLQVAVSQDCRGRGEMMRVAHGYLNNRVFIDDAHINNPPAVCTTRSKPRYLGSAGWYSSVPYAWGMADSVAEFNNFMWQSGFFAGDYTNPNSGCSRGVDCSGFVSNVWGLGYQHGTCTLDDPEVTVALGGFSDLKIGDIVNICGAPGHVILFEEFGNLGTGAGMFGIEAYAAANLDRVVRQFRTFASINTYTPRRYVRACDRMVLPLVQRFQIQKGAEAYPPPNPYP